MTVTEDLRSLRLTWKRDGNGTYTSGAYRVGRTQTGEWWAEGPGVDRVFDHKRDAQAACQQVAAA